MVITAVPHRRYLTGDATVPSATKAISHRICADGLALFDGVYSIEAMLAVARPLMTITPHPDSDERGVTVIAELGPAANQPNANGFSHHELIAHTDRSGIPEPSALMMLTCAIQAPAGGASRFTDGLAVYGDLAAHCPDALGPLSRPHSALFGGAAGYLSSVFTQVPGTGSPRIAIRLRLDDLVSFSPDVAEWIPQLTAAINRHSFTTTLQPGQGVILDNHRWLHARDTFQGLRRIYRLLGNPLANIPMAPGIPAEPAEPIDPVSSQP
jgi:alpha-ketoglutarate-dependent taurine dioxygenase